LRNLTGCFLHGMAFGVVLSLCPKVRKTHAREKLREVPRLRVAQLHG